VKLGSLESARRDHDTFYAAYVLILVLDLRKGEVLGLTWDRVNLDAAELYVGEQLQRVNGRLIRRPVKTESSEAPLPLPDLCITALKLRKQQQDADRARAGDAWQDTGLVFTGHHGTPIEPSNFDRNFNRRIDKADVPRITRHSTRKTCGSLLAALDVHPRVAMQTPRHSKIAITMEIYTEVPSATTREALRKLGEWLDQDHADGQDDDEGPGDEDSDGRREDDESYCNRCCTLLLHQVSQGLVRRSHYGSDLRGAKGTRTPGLLDANQTLFQLSYSPGTPLAKGTRCGGCAVATRHGSLRATGSI